VLVLDKRAAASGDMGGDLPVQVLDRLNQGL